MKKSFFYVMFLGIFLAGVTLGRCENDTIEINIPSVVAMTAKAANTLNLEKNQGSVSLKLDADSEDLLKSYVQINRIDKGLSLTETIENGTYESPSTMAQLLEATGGVLSWVNPFAWSLSRKLMAYQVAYHLSYPYGEVVSLAAIQGIGLGMSLINAPAAAAFVTSATAINHFISFVPGGPAFRGLMLLPLVDPLVEPVAETSWWLAKQAGSLLWGASQWAYGSMTTKESVLNPDEPSEASEAKTQASANGFFSFFSR